MKMAQANRDSRRLHLSLTVTGRASEHAVHDKDAWTWDRLSGQQRERIHDRGKYDEAYLQRIRQINKRILGLSVYGYCHSFQKCSISNNMDGSEDDALYSNLVFGRKTVDSESQAKVPE